jgi:Histidine kinase-, DNA gyrase B-, and HSP90-like ATPase
VPNRKDDLCFSILDNGKGMTAAQFERRWRKLDYNRVAEEGTKVDPPDELNHFPPRRTYGRNGRGRHAAFRFSDPYIVRTWRDGTAVTFEVRRGTNQPFEIKLRETRKGIDGHGTEITATSSGGVIMTAEEAREVIGSRFLADPNFKVSIDGTKVTFDDVPALRLKETDVPVPPFGRLRPDFVMLPDGSVGFYSRDSHDLGHEVNGVARLVVAEIKKPGVVIGSEQKSQAWKYVKELIQGTHITRATDVTCFVLGSVVDETESGDRKEWDDRVIIRPMSYSVFIKRAEKRMLGLRDKLRDAPFLQEHGMDGKDFIGVQQPLQPELELSGKAVV